MLHTMHTIVSSVQDTSSADASVQQSERYMNYMSTKTIPADRQPEIIWNLRQCSMSQDNVSIYLHAKKHVMYSDS